MKYEIQMNGDDHKFYIHAIVAGPFDSLQDARIVQTSYTSGLRVTEDYYCDRHKPRQFSKL